MSKRVVECADVLSWLRERPRLDGCSIVASLPDYSEFPKLTLDEWKAWFTETAKQILERTPDDGVALFFQSDIKREGVWVDKAYLVARAAEITDHALLFHKIFCRAPAGQTTFGKPSYSHLLAFSKGVRPGIEESTADVIPDLGEKTWARGMGIVACRIACEFIQRSTKTRTVVSLFSGEGSVLAVANHLGLDAIGVERSPKRADRSKLLRVTASGDAWETIDVRPSSSSSD